MSRKSDMEQACLSSQVLLRGQVEIIYTQLPDANFNADRSKTKKLFKI